jgi:hypothetical protein
VIGWTMRRGEPKAAELAEAPAGVADAQVQADVLDTGPVFELQLQSGEPRRGAKPPATATAVGSLFTGRETLGRRVLTAARWGLPEKGTEDLRLEVQGKAPAAKAAGALDYGSENVLVTKEQAAAVKARMAAAKAERQLGAIRLGPRRRGRPEARVGQEARDLVTLGLYHFEAGLRSFADWSAQMVEELGEAVRPQLRAAWTAVQQQWEKVAPQREYERVKQEIVGPAAAARLSRPASHLVGWWDRLTRELFHQDIGPERARDHLRRALVEAGLDRNRIGPAHDPYETLARATNRAGYRYHTIRTDGWFEGGRKVAPGMEELEKVALAAPRLPEGPRTVEHFWVYATMRRVRELLERRVPQPASWNPAAVERVIRYLEAPRFSQAFDMLQQWQQQARLQLEESGLKGQGWAQAMAEAHPNYVRLARVVLEGTEETARLRADQAVPQLVQRIRGGRLLVKDPRSEMLRQAQVWLNVAQIWKSRRQFVEWAEMVPEAARAIGMERVPEEEISQRAELAIREVVDEISRGDAEGNLTELLADALGSSEFIRRSLARDLGPDVLPVMRNGEVEFWRWPPELVEAYGSRGPSMAPWISNVLKVIASAKVVKQAATTTYAAKWIVRNILRDIPDGIMQTEGYFPILRDLAGAARAIATKSQEFRELTWEGALQGRREALTMEPGVIEVKEPGTLARRWQRIRERGGPGVAEAEKWAMRFWNVAALPFRAIERAGEFVESVPRIAAGRQAIRRAARQGMNRENAVAAGAGEARISTLPFERGGRAVKLANRAKAFLAAGFQGIYTPLRVLRERPVETCLKGLMYITTPTMLLYAVNHDNPDWQNLPAYRKYGCLNIPIGHDEKGETRWAYVPTPWVWHVIFGASAIAACEHLRKTDPEAWKEFVAQAWTSLSPTGEGIEPKEAGSWAEVGEQALVGGVLGIAPDIAAPVIGLYANKNWTGRDIIPYWELSKDPKEQVAEWNSELARLIGSHFPGGGVSPRKVDYLLQEYGGTLERDINAGIDKLVSYTGARKRAESVTDPGWLARGLAGTATSGESDLKADFYAELRRLERVASRYEEAADGEIPDVPAEAEADLDRYDDARDIQLELSDIGKERREISAGEGTRAEKRKEMDRLVGEEVRLLSAFFKRKVPEWAEK